GNAALMDELGVSIEAVAERAEALRAEGSTVVFLAEVGEEERALVGLLAAADPIKATTPEAVRLLHEAGVRVVMLTGDASTTAAAVARRLGIDEVHAEVRPTDKAAHVEALRREGRVVAMAGDGVNDAP